MPQDKPIIFFDGVCTLCNGAVDWLIRHDVHDQFLYASLQGPTAQKCLGGFKTIPDTIVYWNPPDSYRRSSAIVRIAWQLGGIWKFLGYLLWIIPKPLRDLGYMLIASSRYQVFGKRDSCRLPTAEERLKFLD